MNFTLYSILLKEDNNLTVTTKERIMQRSKLVDTLRFVVEPTYKGEDMSLYTVSMEYVLPISREPHSEILTLNEERLEEGYLVYTVPFDTNLTAEAGKIDIWLTFVYVDMDDTGKIIQKVRKTSSCSVDIIPVAAWTNIIPDEALAAIDQRLLVVNAQIRAMEDMQNQTAIDLSTKADGILYDENTNILQLTSNGSLIGEAVDLTELENSEGITTVEFSASEDYETGYEVVEF